MKLTRALYFEPRNTATYRVDARLKIFWLVVVSVLVFAVGLVSNLLLFAYISLLLIASRISLARVFAVLKGVLVFVVIAVAGNAFFTQGEVLFSIGAMSATREGLYQGALVGLRLITLFLASIFVSMTTSTLQLSEAFEFFLSPLSLLRINTAEIAFILTLAVRAIMLLSREAEELIKSQQAKGITASGPIKRRLKALYLFLVPLVFLTIRRSEEMAFALELRGFDPRRKKLKLEETRWTGESTAFLLAGAALVATAIYLSVVVA